MFAAFALAALPLALAATISVDVGEDGLTYTPEFVTAMEGDNVIFTFHPKNHTVTQTSFATPCIPLAGGFNSDFKPVQDDGLLPTYTVTVSNASIPLWFSCQQTGHCGQGMVFAINPPAPGDPHDFATFQAMAIEQNGTSTATVDTATLTATDFTTVSAQTWQTATATVEDSTSTWITTYTSYAGSASPSVAATPIDHLIVVGVNGTIAYGPANISAAIGDTVTFQFHPKNHTVTQSSFSAPCQPIADTVAGKVGFASGFMPVSANATTFPTFTITVNDTAPVWGYCGQTGHCGMGMVFSINAVETGPNNFAAFQALAEHINGTSTATTSSSTATSTSGKSNNNAALASTRTHGAAIALSLFLAVACFM